MVGSATDADRGEFQADVAGVADMIGAWYRAATGQTLSTLQRCEVLRAAQEIEWRGDGTATLDDFYRACRDDAVVKAVRGLAASYAGVLASATKV